MGAADDGQSNGASLLGLGDSLGCARRSLGPSSCAAELLRVGEDEVHVLVEGEHLPNHLPVVLKCHLHAVVDEVLHLALSVGGSHGNCCASEDDLGFKK